MTVLHAMTRHLIFSFSCVILSFEWAVFIFFWLHNWILIFSFSWYTNLDVILYCLRKLLLLWSPTMTSELWAALVVKAVSSSLLQTLVAYYGQSLIGNRCCHWIYQDTLFTNLTFSWKLQRTSTMLSGSGWRKESPLNARFALSTLR